MSHRLIRTSGVWVVALCAVLCLSGCSRWDASQVIRPRYDTSLSDEPSRPIATPVPTIAQPDVPIASPQGAASDRRLTVQQAYLRALGQNPDFRVQQFEPAIAASLEQLERGNFDPEVFARGEYAEEKSSEVARSTGTEFDVDARDTSGEAGIRQQLPTGTELELVLSQGRTISNRAPEQQVARAGLTVTQSLLRGFGPTVNLAGVRQARLETEATLHELRRYAEELVAQAESAYWNAVRAGRRVRIFEDSLTVAEKELDQIQQRIEVGTLPEIDAAAARAEVAFSRQQLLNALAERRQQRLDLLVVMGYDQSEWADLQFSYATAPEAPEELPGDLGERVELALQQRPDLAEAKLRLRQNELETVVTRNGVLPRLDVFMTLGRTGYADTFVESFKGMGDGTYDFTAGLEFSHFLGNRQARAQDDIAWARRLQGEESIRNLEQLVARSVRSAYIEVERTWSQIAATRATREAREAALQAERDRFSVGRGTSLLVATAQRDLTASRIEEVDAIIQHRLALIDLYVEEGSLLERRGITWDGIGDR